MNIIFRMGNPKELPVFLCDSCGCEFATDEFIIDTIVDGHEVINTRTTTCPCCGIEAESTTVERE